MNVAIRQMPKELRRAGRNSSLAEPVRIVDAGANRVVVTLHQRGKPHGSDSWVEMDYGLVYTVEERLISRADFYATPQKALEAAGL